MKKLLYTLLVSSLIVVACAEDNDNNTNTNPVIQDADNDTVADAMDNCPNHANTNQSDVDGDGMGDVCDADIDADNIANNADNCPSNHNPKQLNFDNDDLGDACDNHAFSRLHHPESVVRHNDYYLVSNLGVSLLPDKADGDGFISVMNIDGTGLIQHHITGLDSPKGLEIINGMLYVCDLSELKVFNIITGQLIKTYSFQAEGVTLLNDITGLYSDNETIFLTATRARKIFKLNINTGTKEVLTVNGQTLLQTNGLALDNANNVLYMAEFGEGNGQNARIIKIDLTNNNGTVLGGSTTGLLYDGIVLTANKLYLSDWSHKLFSLDLNNPNTPPVQLLAGLSGPADIFHDTNTNKIIIPSMTAHELRFYDL